ncbi:MAG: 50S ribosomal protein L25, partial [Cellulomonadaceae bacterium]|nr:50S ribosomal protein L25 [Cellulomonadaceae bacterium]
DLEEGHVVHAKDLLMPPGSVLETDPEAAIVLITVPKEEVVEETEAAEGEEEGAEGEAGAEAEAEAEEAAE